LWILLALIPVNPGAFENPLDISWFCKTRGIGHRNHQTNTEHLRVSHLLVFRPRGFLIRTKSLHWIEPQALIRYYLNQLYHIFKTSFDFLLTSHRRKGGVARDFRSLPFPQLISPSTVLYSTVHAEKLDGFARVEHF
jgi:hypothetical protein